MCLIQKVRGSPKYISYDLTQFNLSINSVEITDFTASSIVNILTNNKKYS